jgi:hypothetical protein
MLVAFRVLNTGGDGYLKRDELVSLLKAMSGNALEDSELQQLVQKFFEANSAMSTSPHQAPPLNHAVSLFSFGEPGCSFEDFTILLADKRIVYKMSVEI